MALAVDTTGRVKASPVTGKPLKGTIADAVDEALKEDLERTGEEQPGVSPGAANVSAIGSKLKAYQPTYGGMPYSQPAPQQASSMGYSDASWMPGPSGREDLSDAANLDIEIPVEPAAATGYWLPGPSGERPDAGIVPPYDPGYTDSAAEWEQDAAAREGREARTSNYWGEEYESRGRVIDPGLAYVGNTPTNDAYMRNAIENGASEDDMYAIAHRPSWWQLVGNAVSRGRHARDEVGPADFDQNRDSLGSPFTMIDDGSSYDYDHMTAELMTGTQYMKYADMGMGGRPIEQIDPAGVYSKRRESVNYGFIPFTPDMTSYSNLVVGNLADIPAEVGGIVANLRDIVTPDYTISYGDGNTINGSDFDNLWQAYLGQVDYFGRFDPERYLAMPANGHATAYVSEYSMTDSDGRTRYAHGDIVDAKRDDNMYLEFGDGQVVTVGPDEYMSWPVIDGQSMIPDDYIEQHGDFVRQIDSDICYLTFTDGQTIGVHEPDLDHGVSRSWIPSESAHGTLPDDLDSLNDADFMAASVERNGGSILDYAGVRYIPDMVMSDGTYVPYSDVDRIRADRIGDDIEDPSDDDISYGFMPLDLNKPSRLANTQQITVDGNGLHFNADDMGLNAIDWTLGSLPISISNDFWSPWAYAASNGLTSLSGANPSSWSPGTDYYGLIAGNYDDNGNLRYGVTDPDGNFYDDRSDRLRLTNAALNAAVPMTENIAGDIGSSPFKNLLSRIGLLQPLGASPGLSRVLTNFLIDAAGEGIEEIVGNVFDEATSYGEDMYATPYTYIGYDGVERPVLDAANREVRRFDTPIAVAPPWDPARSSGEDGASLIDDRLGNVMSSGGDFANAFYGGVLVDAVMNLLGLSENGPLVPRIVNGAIASDARRHTGVAPFVSPDDVVPKAGVGAGVDEGYADRYDDIISREER